MVDILTALDNNADYSKTQLQFIFGAWVLTGLLDKKKKIQLDDGDVAEEDYDKASIYSLLYALYRSTGGGREATTGSGYEFTFNTWGYSWPDSWGKNPVGKTDPQRYGKNAYTGLYQFDDVKRYVDGKDGKVHVVEMGCGTGAGAHHVCKNVLKNASYDAVDMQVAAIETCKRKYVPELGGRLKATCADATKLGLADGVADFIAVNETHVTEQPGRVTEEDERFFRTAFRVLKPGGYIVWGNAIPTSTWKPCLDYLESIGMKMRDVRDVTKEAVRARDEDKGRIDCYFDQCKEKWFGFRIPVLRGRRSCSRQTERALKNFSRHPGTRLYENMVDGTDSYKVVLAQRRFEGAPPREHARLAAKINAGFRSGEPAPRRAFGTTWARPTVAAKPRRGVFAPPPATARSAGREGVGKRDSDQGLARRRKRCVPGCRGHRASEGG